MAFSMTGFGRGEASSANRRFVVEIRSVNHRYCDISIKMPRTFANLEERIRQMVTHKINRGKIDVYINCDEFGERECAVATDTGLAGAYIEAAGVLAARFKLRDDISLNSLLRMPGIFQVNEETPDDDEIWEILGESARLAIDALIAMRGREGGELIAEILDRLHILTGLVARIDERAPNIVSGYRDRLNARIAELLGQNVPDETGSP